MTGSLPLRALLGLGIFLLPSLSWGCGTDVDGPIESLTACVYGEELSLAPAEVVQLVGESRQTQCVRAAGAEAGDFIYIPFFATRGTDDPPELTLGVEITGVRAVPSSPGMNVSGASQGDRIIPGEDRWTSDVHFHDWLRRREIRELEPLIRSAGARRVDPAAADPAGAVAMGAQGVPAEGELLSFNVAISCSEWDVHTGRVAYVSDHAVLVGDTANPSGMSAFDYARIGAAFDTVVRPVSATHFGESGDIDGNGRTILFFTRAVNELTAPGSAEITLGFFWSGDLFPEEETSKLAACPASNQAEILYLIAPDPLGHVGRAIDVPRLRELIVPLMGHEMQHLANASRRLFVNDATALEEPWLNEGLSHIAEELLFYRVTGLGSDGNLGYGDVEAVDGVAALDRFMWGNLSNFGRFLSRPDTASLMGIDRLATRGATWSFLRYAADRSGRGDPAFFLDLVNGRTAGLENLDRVVGAPALDWMQDWTVAVYADDYLPDVAARYTQPSWDFRALWGDYAKLAETFPLRPQWLVPGAKVDLTLGAGGTSFTAFGVRAAEQAVLHVESSGYPARSAVRGSLVRIR